MINYILMLVIIIGVFLQSVFKKQYNVKEINGNGSTNYFNFIMAVSSFLFFLVSIIFVKFEFNVTTLLYSLAFSMCFLMAVVFSLLSIKEGSFSLSSLFLSFSLVIPALYGLIFLKEKLSPLAIVGLVFVFVSMVCVNKYKKGEKVTIRWFVYVLLSFLGNGFCSTVQKMFQVVNNGADNIQFMFFVSLFFMLFTGAILFFTKPKKSCIILGKNIVFPIFTGVANSVCNFLVLILAGRLPATILYPSVAGGGIALTFIVAILFYKEKLSVVQFVGYILGIISIVILSI